MRRLLVLGAVLLAGVPAEAGPLTRCSKKQVVRLNEKLNGCVLDFTDNHKADNRFDSPVLGEKRSLYVYLPPGFDPAERYPVMIWLHGILQDEKNFLTLAPVFDAEIAAGRLPPMIIACPDGSIKGRPTFFNGGSFYINSKAGRFEDYLAGDVWDFVTTNFQVRPEREAHVIAGGSMGGFGAYNHAIKHRDRYKVVVGIMPPLNLRYEDCHGRYFRNFDPNCLGWADRYRPYASVGSFGIIHIPQWILMDPLFGKDPVITHRALTEENPVEMLATRDVKPGELSMFIGVGEKDQFNLDAQVDSFVFFAHKRGIEPYVVRDPKGRHNSETGLRMMPAFAAWLTPQIKDYAPPLKLAPPLLK
jgi:pimeloyl-ACP methyl ester carboxylesterase